MAIRYLLVKEVYTQSSAPTVIYGIDTTTLSGGKTFDFIPLGSSSANPNDATFNTSVYNASVSGNTINLLQSGVIETASAQHMYYPGGSSGSSVSYYLEHTAQFYGDFAAIPSDAYAIDSLHVGPDTWYYNRYWVYKYDNAAPIFTTGADTVDFNLPSVQAQISPAVDIYHGLGGNDVVKLPDLTSYGAAGWSNSTVFVAGDTAGQAYTIIGGTGADKIQLGAGTDTYYGSPGNDAITAGAGADTFDYTASTASRFGNFVGYSSSASNSQTIDGGAGIDVLKLPGSPGGYTQVVTFGTSLADAHTTFGPSGLSVIVPSSVAIDTVHVEKVKFQNQISNPVFVEANNVAVEEIQLAVDAYPTKTSSVLPLAWEMGGSVAASTNMSADAVSRGWHPVSAMELGIAPGATGTGRDGAVQYSFVGGFYQAEDTADSFHGELAQADALVVVGVVNNVRTLSISFAGTDQEADIVGDWADFANQSTKLFPLFNAVKDYVNDGTNGIQKVLVAGHSLGAAMAQDFMDFLPDSSTYTASAYTIGSPGDDDFPFQGTDSRITNFVIGDDLVPKVAGKYAPNIGAALIVTIPFFKSLDVAAIPSHVLEKFREGTDVALPWTLSPTDAHDRNVYLQEVKDYYSGRASDTHLISLDNGHRALIHEDSIQGNTGTGTQLNLQMIDSNDPGQSSPIVGATSPISQDAHSDLAALHTGGFASVWTSPNGPSGTDDIHAAVYDSDGDVVRNDFVVNTTTAGSQDSAHLTSMDDGGFLVTWDDLNSGVERAQRLDSSGNHIGPELTTFSGAITDSSVSTLSDGRTLLSFNDNPALNEILDTRTSVTGHGTGHDLFGDGSADQLILRTSASNGGTLTMFDLNPTGGLTQIGLVGADWAVAGSGDLNGDGRSDLIMQHDVGTDRQLYAFMMGAGTVSAITKFGDIGPDWQIDGSGDFNGDGYKDVLLERLVNNTKELDVLGVQKGAVTSVKVAGVVPVAFQVDGIGDMNKDGKDDILAHYDDASGRHFVELDEANYTTQAVKTVATVGVDWHALGLGDFDGDGFADILITHDTANARDIGILVNPGASGGAWAFKDLGPILGQNVQIDGIGDFNGDGTADISAHYDTSGTVRANIYLEVHNDAITAIHSTGSVGHEWILA